MTMKRKNKKMGSAPPLRKIYIYWLIAGLVLLVGMRHQDIRRFVQKKRGVTPSVGRLASAEKEAVSGRMLRDAVDCLSEVTDHAKNQLMVVRYFITQAQSDEKTAEELLAWIPTIQAVYRDYSGGWRIVTQKGVSQKPGTRPVRYRVGGVIETEKDPLRVVYVDEHSVLLCSVLEKKGSYLAAALPITEIRKSSTETVLKVKKNRVSQGDHLLFNGWDCEVRTVARDRFEMAVKPLKAQDAGVVVMYQFVF